MDNPFYDAGHDLIEQFASLDFTEGAPFYILLLIVSFYICFEGFRIYKMILSLAGFCIAFYAAGKFIPQGLIDPQYLLMAEVGIGIAIGALAYKLMVLGVFVVTFYLAMNNLPALLESFLDIRVTGLIATGLAVVVAVLSTKSVRMVFVILTAVLGAFTAIDALIGLMPYVPSAALEEILPAPDSGLWFIAKIGLSAAGAAIQGIKKVEE